MMLHAAARPGGNTGTVSYGPPAALGSLSRGARTLLAFVLMLAAGRFASAQIPDAPSPMSGENGSLAPAEETASLGTGYSSSNIDLLSRPNPVSSAFILNGRLAPRTNLPRQRDKILMWSAIAAEASARSLDVYSTTSALDRGCHELILPDAIAGSPTAMSLFGAGVVVSNYFIARRLARHRHYMRWMAPASDAASTGFFATHNLFLSCPRSGKIISTPTPIRPPGFPVWPAPVAGSTPVR